MEKKLTDIRGELRGRGPGNSAIQRVRVGMGGEEPTFVGKKSEFNYRAMTCISSTHRRSSSTEREKRRRNETGPWIPRGELGLRKKGEVGTEILCGAFKRGPTSHRFDTPERGKLALGGFPLSRERGGWGCEGY